MRRRSSDSRTVVRSKLASAPISFSFSTSTSECSPTKWEAIRSISLSAAERLSKDRSSKGDFCPRPPLQAAFFRYFMRSDRNARLRSGRQSDRSRYLRRKDCQRIALAKGIFAQDRLSRRLFSDISCDQIGMLAYEVGGNPIDLVICGGKIVKGSL